MTTLKERLQSIESRMEKAARAAGRNRDEIKLIAICKTFPAEIVREAAACGQFRFGENKVQEAAKKIPQVDSPHPLEWHLVGHLQTNKARRAAELFDWIHSVDSLKLLAKLQQAASEIGKVLSVLVQVDLVGEETKSGMEPDQVEELLAGATNFSNVRVRGLMILPPFLPDPEEVRLYFRQLRKLRDDLSWRFPQHPLTELSMGMSHDFEAAIAEGSTLIRVGTAIFGGR